ncbi:MAG: B-box zinc finger protein, partial [Kofleriaceae bacterium]
MTTEHATCRSHPEAIAGWHCDTCKQPLCESCTASLLGQFSCSHCGETARQMTVARTSKGFGHWLVRALVYPVSRGLPLFAIMVLVFGALPFVTSILETAPHQLDSVVSTLRAVLVALYVLVVIDTTVRGGAESGRIIRLARLLVATSIVWFPAGAYAYLVGPPGKAALSDYAMWLYVVLAVFYVPLALAFAATDISFSDSANPFKVFEFGGR